MLFPVHSATFFSTKPSLSRGSWIAQCNHLGMFIFIYSLLKILFIYLFFEERGREGERGRETSVWERNIDPLPLAHALNRGQNAQPRHLPWPGIELAAFFLTLQNNTQPVEPQPTDWVGAYFYYLFIYCPLVRERERRNISCLSPVHAQSKNQTHILLVYRLMLQPTELPSQVHLGIFKNYWCRAFILMSLVWNVTWALEIWSLLCDSNA